MSKTANQIEIRDILALMWRRKWLIIIPVPLIAALTFAGSYLIAPEYESSTIIQIDPQIQLIGDLAVLIGQQASRDGRLADSRQDRLRSVYNDITSSHYAELLDERMHLLDKPELELKAQAFILQQPNMAIEQARLLVIQDQLKEDVNVEWASGDHIRISIVSVDAEVARDMANNLGDIFIAEMIRNDLSRIRSSQDFSDVQLEKYELQVRDKMAEVTEVEQIVARLRSSNATTSEANRSEIQNEIDQTDSEVEDLRQDERDLLVQLRGVEGLNIDALELDDSETRRTANEELLNRLRQIGALLSRYTWSDPQVINFKVRQGNLIAEIEAEDKILVDRKYGEFNQATRNRLTTLFNARSRLNYLYTKKPYLVSALGDLTPVTDLIPQYEAQLVQLRTELLVATDIRDQFRRQTESSTISQALVEDRSSSKYRKVEPAKLAIAPFKPNRNNILILGLVLGLAIGGAAVLLVELMDNSFKTVEDVEETLGLPVIGISPKVDFDKRLMRG